MIIESLSAGRVRLALRLYFLIAIALSTWLAEGFLLIRAKLQLIRTHTAPIHNVLGWTQGYGLLKIPLSLGRLPAGKLGYMAMLVVFLLSQLSDLITTTLVKQTPIHSRCAFGTGLVVNTTGPELFVAPPVNGIPYIVAHNSQYFSLNNTCDIGIYAKVNTETNFCPTAEDILGTWNCSRGAETTYPAGTSIDSIIKSLQSQKLLSSNVSHEFSSASNSSYDHLVMWSSSAKSDTAGTPWSVLAAVQANSGPFDDITILPLSCSLAAPPVQNVVNAMASLKALSLWKLTFQGLMFYGTGTPLVADPEQQLAILLNTMIMVQGGSNALLSTPAPDADQDQGCVVMATEVPRAVEVLVMITAVLLVTLLMLWLIFASVLSMQHKEGRKMAENLPKDVLGWVAMAATEHQLSINPQYSGQIKQRALRTWILGTEEGAAQRLRIMARVAKVDSSNGLLEFQETATAK
ncbi:hypothetical protein BP6252_11131 [Coleophoma cylindrospora]|uniref:Uncharacterized protein n=1 Tax=Coleophoma cylindrospora TaxID=1849047 RepID=A0A3D8QP28_9HELO|nr:hypothetical protein BP6252_11131 [Coleophoma cylindrospora]